MGPIVTGIISSIIDSIIGSVMTPVPVLPPDTPVGVVRPMVQDKILTIMGPPAPDGFAYFGNVRLRLAASLQIRDTQNRIIMPSTLQNPVPVLYKFDLDGVSVQRVWVLTWEEAEVAKEIILQRLAQAAQQQPQQQSTQ
jgi:hypothetical protein